MPSHIPLTELVPLAGCLVLVGAELQSEQQRCLHGDADRCVAAIAALATRCKNAKNGTASKGAIDEFMGGLIAAADGENASENTASVRIWHDALVSRASAVTCGNCCKGRDVCKGGDFASHDAKTVDSYGLCIAPLKAAFDDAKRITSKAYHHAQGRDLNAAKLSTKLIQQHSGALANLFGCGAAFNVMGGEPQVTLSVDTRNYSVATFFYTLYLFVHELFSHGKCGIPTGTEQSRTSVSFSEGWMDWVAVRSMEHVGDECGLGSDARFKWSSALTRAYSYHDARIDPGRNCDSGGVYRYGAVAAEKLLFLVRAVAPDKGRDAAFWYVAQFSMDINASEQPDEARSQLVDRVSHYLGTALSPMDAWDLAPTSWITAIRRYVQDSDAERLFGQITGLESSFS
jgi:hypothetical protein